MDSLTIFFYRYLFLRKRYSCQKNLQKESKTKYKLSKGSSVNSYAHPIYFLIIVMVKFTILTPYTFTFLRTFQTCTKTLTIFLFTLRLFACTFSQRNECWNVFEKSRISIICDLFSLIYFFLIFGFIPTTYTYTVFATSPSTSETLTIKFKTVYFCTFTSLYLSFVFNLYRS